MAYTDESDLRIRLDKVDRKFIKELKDKKPEYWDLELYQVAKLELRERLFQEIRKLRKAPGNPGDGQDRIKSRDTWISGNPEEISIF